MAGRVPWWSKRVRCAADRSAPDQNLRLRDSDSALDRNLRVRNYIPATFGLLSICPYLFRPICFVPPKLFVSSQKWIVSSRKYSFRPKNIRFVPKRFVSSRKWIVSSQKYSFRPKKWFVSSQKMNRFVPKIFVSSQKWTRPPQNNLTQPKKDLTRPK